MTTAIILLQLAIVVALIFKGARVGGIGLGIYGMVGVFILVFGFGLKPGNLPIDVMLIIPVMPSDAAMVDTLSGRSGRILELVAISEMMGRSE